MHKVLSWKITGIFLFLPMRYVPVQLLIYSGTVFITSNPKCRPKKLTKHLCQFLLWMTYRLELASSLPPSNLYTFPYMTYSKLSARDAPDSVASNSPSSGRPSSRRLVAITIRNFSPSG